MHYNTICGLLSLDQIDLLNEKEEQKYNYATPLG